MHKVFKYQFSGLEIETFQIPRAARIVYVDVQHGYTTMWALVDTENEMSIRRFQIVGTGHEIPFQGSYIGSVQMPPFVWHVFEIPLVKED